MRKALVATVCIVAIGASGCSAGRTNAGVETTVPARTSSASYLLSQPDAAALVEWTANDGEVIGNITVATVNTGSMSVDQVVTPITGFVTPDGEVGLEYGKGSLSANLTGHIDGDTLSLAGPFGLSDRAQFAFAKARPGDWEAALALLDRAIESAYDANLAAGGEEPSDPEVGDPYVDYDAENRRFDTEISNIDILTATAERSVADVDAAAGVLPMDSMQLTQVGDAVSTVEITVSDTRSALARLESHYVELQSLLLDEAIKSFSARLDSARETTARAEDAAERANEIYEEAALRVQD